MVTPGLPVKPITQWKRLAIISFFGGLGTGLGVALLFASAYWYNARPKQWNAQAIRAHHMESDCFPLLEDWFQEYQEKRRRGELLPGELSPGVPKPTPGFIAIVGKMRLRFSYDLENTTSSDYTLKLPQSYGLQVMQRLRSSDTLVNGKGVTWFIAEPLNIAAPAENKAILIPARQSVRVVFSMDYEILDDPGTMSDWSNKGVQKDFVRTMLKDADSLVLLDETRRYRIDLPLQDALR
jgi:hypothetical protein